MELGTTSSCVWVVVEFEVRQPQSCRAAARTHPRDSETLTGRDRDKRAFAAGCSAVPAARYQEIQPLALQNALVSPIGLFRIGETLLLHGTPPGLAAPDCAAEPAYAMAQFRGSPLPCCDFAENSGGSARVSAISSAIASATSANQRSSPEAQSEPAKNPNRLPRVALAAKSLIPLVIRATPSRIPTSQPASSESSVFRGKYAEQAPKTA